MHFDDLDEDCSNSTAYTLDSLYTCTKLSISYTYNHALRKAASLNKLLP